MAVRREETLAALQESHTGIVLIASCGGIPTTATIFQDTGHSSRSLSGVSMSLARVNYNRLDRRAAHTWMCVGYADF